MIKERGLNLYIFEIFYGLFRVGATAVVNIYPELAATLKGVGKISK